MTKNILIGSTVVYLIYAHETRNTCDFSLFGEMYDENTLFRILASHFIFNTQPETVKPAFPQLHSF